MIRVMMGCLVFLSTVSVAGVWNIDDGHSSARFKVRHFMVSNVSGELAGIKGTFDVDDKDITKTKIEAVIDANTISTNNAKRDAHLKNADFLDVPTHPTITFKSKSVKKAGKGLKIVGDFTLHGVTKEITLNSEGLSKEVTDPRGSVRRGFTAATKISRKDFGVGSHDPMKGGGFTIGDEVTIDIELELVAEKKAAAN